MKKQLLIGLLLAFFIGIQANIMPEKPPGVKSDVVIEQSDIICLDFDVPVLELSILVNYVEVGMSPDVNKEVFIVSSDIENRTLENNELQIKDDNYKLGPESINLSLFIREKERLNNRYTLNHELCEISPGDNLA